MPWLSPVVLILTILLSATPLVAQSATQISGTVRSDEQTPVTDAVITIVELRRSTKVDANGSFQFDDVPAGHYHLSVESRRMGATIAEADVVAGTNNVVEVVLDPAVHAEQIVVSAGPEARSADEVYQSVAVMNQEELAARLEPTLGETLSKEPGVNSTYFGPGSSRPIIRGFGADRIRILTSGLGTSDVSNVSPDHAVSVDASNAEQVEIVRGPATLLYGSNAVGGVVNVIDSRIPDSVPTQPVTGHLDLRASSAADERTGAVSLDGGKGPFAWHIDYTDRETDDYEIPGFALHQHEGEEPDEDAVKGILENSSLDSRTGTIGASWIGSRGFIGLSWNSFDTNYGIPGGGHAHEDAGRAPYQEEEEEEEEFVRIDLEQRRFDIRGELNDLGFIRKLRLRLGRNEYEHVELEGEEIGTRFLNDGLEGRIEANHRQFGKLAGSFGVQFSDSDSAAIGEEAFVPPNETRTAAVFVFEELRGTKWDFQGGARFETQEVHTTADLPDRDFDGFSTSFGTIFRPIDGYAVTASIARAVRLPTATELYANGPHIATAQFEVGNPDLEEETSVGIDFSLRKTEGTFRAELNLFNNTFDGYIFDMPTGLEQDALPVFQYVQADARFRGMEIDTHTELWHSDMSHLELELGGDYVRATLDDGGDLPRIPPLRTAIGLRFHGGAFNASAEARRYFDQDDVADFEEETDGYTMVNANVGYRFFIRNSVHDVLLRGTNLTDEEARVHSSALKERAPLPGRDFALSYRVTF